MARLIHKLTGAKIRTLTDIKLHPDGAGLYLQIKPGGARSWIYRFTLNGRTRDMGLGAFADVSLVKARERPAPRGPWWMTELIRSSIPAHKPLYPPRRSGVPRPPSRKWPKPTWADRLKRLRSEKHRHQWRQTLVDYAYPVIGKMPVNEIETNDVLAVLKPIWEAKCETAARLRGRIERVLARATVEGHRSGSNPATWRGHLQEALPARSEVQPVKHFRAMEFRDLPAFMAELCQIDTISAAALRFLILTAARTGEVLGARWTEIDWTEKTWTLAAIRAKTKREHIIPLSTGALAALREVEPLRGVSGDFVFPGHKGGLASMTFLVLLQRRMNRAVTVHGFRSAFRDWCGDEGEVSV